jgi:hypothetical protein
MKLDRDKLRFALVICGAVPFFFFLNQAWAKIGLLIYIPTACLFGLLLVDYYPPLRTAHLWKALIPIIVFHAAVIYVLVWVNLALPGLDGYPRFFYGIVTVVMFLEWGLSVRVIKWCE